MASFILIFRFTRKLRLWALLRPAYLSAVAESIEENEVEMETFVPFPEGVEGAWEVAVLLALPWESLLTAPVELILEELVFGFAAISGAKVARRTGSDHGPFVALLMGLLPLKKWFASISTDCLGSCRLPLASTCRPISFLAFLLSILPKETILLVVSVFETMFLNPRRLLSLVARL